MFVTTPFSVRNFGKFLKFGRHIEYKNFFDDQDGAQIFENFENNMEDATDR
jgi:hypothetical protein